jgi:hypothetical protein
VLPSGEYEFTGHAEHDALPGTDLYVFCGHALQVPPSAPVKPALHLQLVKRILALEDCEFAGHAVQAAEPMLSLYLPATHAEHSPPSAPVYPTWH